MKTPKDRDAVLARFRNGPALLEQALSGLQEAELDMSPVRGGWTIRQIVHHIADGDDIWKMCIKQALGNDRSEFSLDWYRALPQDDWADRWAYAQRPVDVSLALLRANRDYVIQLLDYTPDGWNRTAEFREPNGDIEIVPVGFIIEMQADHIEHHVNRILAIRQEREGA